MTVRGFRCIIFDPCLYGIEGDESRTSSITSVDLVDNFLQLLDNLWFINVKSIVNHCYFPTYGRYVLASILLERLSIFSELIALCDRIDASMRVLCRLISLST